jgi:hypothetical protein
LLAFAYLPRLIDSTVPVLTVQRQSAIFVQLYSTSRTDLQVGAIFTISAVYHVGAIMAIDAVLHIGAILALATTCHVRALLALFAVCAVAAE